MSGRSGDGKMGATETVGICVLSLLLSTLAGAVSAAPSASWQPLPSTPAPTSSGAILLSLRMPSLYLPSAGTAVRDAPFDPGKPKPTPIPAPAGSNDYAAVCRCDTSVSI